MTNDVLNDVYARFNVAEILHDTEELLKECSKPTKYAQKLVEESLVRHADFFGLGFDELGRKELLIPVTADNIRDDNPWFNSLLTDVLNENEAIAIIQNQVWITESKKDKVTGKIISRGMPITKALAKKGNAVFYSRNRTRKWIDKYPDEQALKVNHQFVLDRLLPVLGEVTNLNRRVVLSINPFDFLRNAQGGKHTSFRTCHALSSGSYRRGVINYALDKNSIVSYVADPNNHRMLGRSIVYVNDERSIVGQFRCYPSPDVFGQTRIQAVRDLICKSIDPHAPWVQDYKLNADRVDGGNGYKDYMHQVSYIKHDETIMSITPDSYGTRRFSPERTDEVMCLQCGCIHINNQIACEKCYGTSEGRGL